ncbi:hypothetical protein DHEL01_v207424 [Diaporthe helianthi]|uniref:Uncharacterized protein n=1 Tax=Diaporthe helianthi TaxID=158607 RepID=A0A2P5HVB4_DIAHE|nr:hypothetical protein DHEL01_v207424 [Diaporthe helianthi]
MLPNTSAYTAILFAVSAGAQKLNRWPEINQSRNTAGNYTDGDINTFEVKPYDVSSDGGTFPMLFETPITISGLYIQCSGDDLITDYVVRGNVGRFSELLAVGRVCGAKGNFTYVPLIDPQTGKPPQTDLWYVDVLGTERSTFTYRINEIWPVFPGDEVVDPKNTSPCPELDSR